MTDQLYPPDSRSQSRRTFEFVSEPPTPGATTPGLEASSPQSPTPGQLDDSEPPTRTKSILNLTSSTLQGIYHSSGYALDREDAPTPRTNGALTPIGESRHGNLDLSKWNLPDTIGLNGPNGKVRRRRSTIRGDKRRVKPGSKGKVLMVVRRAMALFATGILYGAVITHLHDRREIAPIKVKGINRTSWPYLTFWGLTGILLGEALPWLDKFWASDTEEDDEAVEEVKDDSMIRISRGVGAWSDVLRSVGAFAGIAFAIRRLPWQSTLQLSLTFALANPAIWYLVDRSLAGFWLSTFFALGGTALLLGTNPQLVPAPRPTSIMGSMQLRDMTLNGTLVPLSRDELVFGLMTQESIGVATWIASVLFVSAVCFGNLGRRLALS